MVVTPRLRALQKSKHSSKFRTVTYDLQSIPIMMKSYVLELLLEVSSNTAFAASSYQISHLH